MLVMKYKTSENVVEDTVLLTCSNAVHHNLIVNFLTLQII